jgi:hypothetical protein
VDKIVDEVVIADLMLAINEKYPNDIDDHFGLRNIVDLQYESHTKAYYTRLAILYVFGFAVPFTIQMFMDQ